jgi:uncharacterized membrane protein YdjX (TVP38/TMEM64 family)
MIVSIPSFMLGLASGIAVSIFILTVALSEYVETTRQSE